MLQRFESLTADGVGDKFSDTFMCFSISIYVKFSPAPTERRRGEKESVLHVWLTLHLFAFSITSRPRRFVGDRKIRQ